MTRFVSSLSCKIRGISWDKYHQTFFPSKNDLSISDNMKFSAVENVSLLMQTNNQQQTDLLQIAGQCKIPATCSHTHQYSSWVEHTSWLLLIPFWLKANYIFLRTFHFLLVSSSSPMPHQNIIDTETLEHDGSGSEQCQSTGASFNAAPTGTQ